MGADRSAVSRVGRAKKNQLTVTSRPSAEHLFYLLKWVSHSRSLILARLLDLGGGEGEYRDVITPTRAHSRSAKYSDVNQLSRETMGPGSWRVVWNTLLVDGSQRTGCGGESQYVITGAGSLALAPRGASPPPRRTGVAPHHRG
ncbi:hypothetical protein J6590_095634 [Homalodisca vitripennis]|nr:hypothetical protein J6590_095634 [Homalodisca vitripennis]